MLENLQRFTEQLGGIVWGPVMVTAMLTIGAYLSVQNRFLQLSGIRFWMGQTIGNVFRARHAPASGGISRTQALATALAGTMGTGNIVGVATALTLGGAGAVFWMWISALFGMMLKYAETVLAVCYRTRDRHGRWIGGAMEVMENGLHQPGLACAFGAFCMMSSLGMGNMTQSNAIAQSMQDAFGVSPTVSGICCAAALALVIFGGLGRIARVAETVIPALSLAYGIGGIAIIAAHGNQLLPVLGRIFSEAFTLRSAVGGAAGMGLLAAMRYGFSRGIFSNEAGLGSSGMVYAAAEDAVPVEQGFWGIFEVFVDTIVVCTITALAILTSGISLTAQTGAALTITAFETLFGRAGSGIVAAAIALFAFASMLGWAYYGERGFEKLAGSGNGTYYRLMFVFAAYLGSVARLELVWGISEIFNGLMAVPNLITLVLLAPVVRRETRAYFHSLARPELPPGRLQHGESVHPG